MTSTTLLELIAVACAAFFGGALIGLRFRAPALLLASTFIVFGTIAVAMQHDWSLMSAVLSAIGVVSLVQSGYLVGSAFLRN